MNALCEILFWLAAIVFILACAVLLVVVLALVYAIPILAIVGLALLVIRLWQWVFP